MLARSVNYEIPDLKRQLAKCQQMHQVCVLIDYAAQINFITVLSL